MLGVCFGELQVQSLGFVEYYDPTVWNEQDIASVIVLKASSNGLVSIRMLLGVGGCVQVM